MNEQKEAAVARVATCTTTAGYTLFWMSNDAQPASSVATYRILRELGARTQRSFAAIREPRELVVVHRFARKDLGSVPGVASVSSEELAILLRDAQALAKNWHPNITRVKHVDRLDGALVIATELVDGVTLEDLLAISKRRGEPFPLDVLVRVSLDVLAGAHGIHALRDGRGVPLGVIHGELCPANIVVGKDGVARIINALRPRPLRILAGGEAVGYAAPEALDGGNLDARTDVYALGVILWEVLTGERLHDEKEPARVLARQRELDIASPTLPAGSPYAPLVDIAMRALSFEPSLRFRTALEMAAELRKLPSIAAGSVVAARVNEIDGERIRGRRAALDPSSSGSRRRVSSQSIAIAKSEAAPVGAAIEEAKPVRARDTADPAPPSSRGERATLPPTSREPSSAEPLVEPSADAVGPLSVEPLSLDSLAIEVVEESTRPAPVQPRTPPVQPRTPPVAAAAAAAPRSHATATNVASSPARGAPAPPPAVAVKRAAPAMPSASSPSTVAAKPVPAKDSPKAAVAKPVAPARPTADPVLPAAKGAVAAPAASEAPLKPATGTVKVSSGPAPLAAKPAVPGKVASAPAAEKPVVPANVAPAVEKPVAPANVAPRPAVAREEPITVSPASTAEPAAQADVAFELVVAEEPAARGLVLLPASPVPALSAPSVMSNDVAPLVGPTSSGPLVVELPASPLDLPFPADVSRTTSSVVIAEGLAAKRAHGDRISREGVSSTLDLAGANDDAHDAGLAHTPKKGRGRFVAAAVALVLLAAAVMLGLRATSKSDRSEAARGTRTATTAPATTTVTEATEPASPPTASGQEITPSASSDVGRSDPPVENTPARRTTSPAIPAAPTSPRTEDGAKRAPRQPPTRRYEPLGI
jgi:eukaryotic-like serine/threonine-protein kinase